MPDNPYSAPQAPLDVAVKEPPLSKRPAVVVLALVCLCLVVAYGAWRLGPRYDNAGNTLARTVFLFTGGGLVALEALLTYLLFRGRRAALIGLAALIALRLIAELVTSYVTERPPLGFGLGSAATLLELVAFGLLFTATARRWFSRSGSA